MPVPQQARSAQPFSKEQAAKPHLVPYRAERNLDRLDLRSTTPTSSCVRVGCGQWELWRRSPIDDGGRRPLLQQLFSLGSRIGTLFHQIQKLLFFPLVSRARRGRLLVEALVNVELLLGLLVASGPCEGLPQLVMGSG